MAASADFVPDMRRPPFGAAFFFLMPADCRDMLAGYVIAEAKARDVVVKVMLAEQPLALRGG